MMFVLNVMANKPPVTDNAEAAMLLPERDITETLPNEAEAADRVPTLMLFPVRDVVFIEPKLAIDPARFPVDNVAKTPDDPVTSLADTVLNTAVGGVYSGF